MLFGIIRKMMYGKASHNNIILSIIIPFFNITAR